MLYYEWTRKLTGAVGHVGEISIKIGVNVACALVPMRRFRGKWTREGEIRRRSSTSLFISDRVAREGASQSIRLRWCVAACSGRLLPFS